VWGEGRGGGEEKCLYVQRLNCKSSLQAATRCVWAPLNRSWTGKRAITEEKTKTGTTKSRACNNNCVSM